MARSTAFMTRRWHKWLSLIVGIQAMIWLASGLYMVIVDLDFIHGDHLITRISDTLPAGYQPELDFAVIQSRYPGADSITLATWIGKPHYTVRAGAERHLVDAETGTVRSPLRREDAIAVANYHYAREGDAVSAELLTDPDTAPTEIQARPLPLWRVDFDDPGSTSFYIRPDDGAFVSRRHNYWRIFDVAWMLHIMDYKERANANNNLLRLAAGLGVGLIMFGAWLLVFSFNHRRKDA